MELRPDIREVQVNPRLPLTQRREAFLHAAGDAHCFRIGEITVHLQFQPAERTISQALADALLKA